MKEIDLVDANSIIEKTGKKFIWLGKEPVDYISKLIDLDDGKMEAVNPGVIRGMKKDELEKFSGDVFVCYHGRTSGSIVSFLKENEIESYNLKGGVTALVGEIFG